MKDKELNEKESLELIARMIRNTRRNLDTGSGNSFLVWGYVGVLVTLAVWAGVTFTGNPVWMWGFWGIPVVGYLLMFLLLRKRQKPVKFYLDKILERVWGVFGMVCLMGVLAATDAGRYETILPLCAIFFSLGSIITGCIIRYTTFFIFPLFGFLWGLKSSRSAPLRELSPLRTVRASFPAYGSSNMTATDFVVGRAISFSTFIFIIYFAFYVYNWYVQEFLPFVR